MSQKKPFYGRKAELTQLAQLTKTSNASLAVVKGRRRIGKSRLLKEFADQSKGYQSYYFTALPPSPSISAEIEREDFAQQLASQLSIPLPRADSWHDLLRTMYETIKEKKCIVIFDEINWMGSKDPSFLGVLKAAWDRDFSLKNHFILFLSGSLSTWIEENILHSTGFLGRVTLDMTLQELSLAECHLFWGHHAHRIATHEKLLLLAAFGGIPRYLEEIIPSQTSLENLQRLCFSPGGLLFREFDNIFHDLFKRRNTIYRKIITAIEEKPLGLSELSEKLEKNERTGKLSKYVDDLEKSGFVTRDYTWKISSGIESRFSRIRLKDNYMRFYLHFISPNHRRIERGNYSPPRQFDALMGLQFENLVLSNRRLIWDKIGIKAEDIMYDNPFFQKKNASAPGCQIDYMIQTRQKSLYVCEIKFSRMPIDSSVIPEVERKIERIKKPKHFSYRPVLIQVSGAIDAVYDSEFFDHIISFEDILMGR